MKAEHVAVFAALLVGCSREQGPERKAASAPAASAATPCASPLREVTFTSCNPTPRFTSQPDCYAFQFAATEPCVSGQMTLYVTAPQVMNEILVSVSNAGPGKLVAKVVTVKGSMLGKFEARQGAEAGVIELESSEPKGFVLGEALLPNEIGAKEATTLE